MKFWELVVAVEHADCHYEQRVTNGLRRQSTFLAEEKLKALQEPRRLGRNPQQEHQLNLYGRRQYPVESADGYADTRGWGLGFGYPQTCSHIPAGVTYPPHP